MLLPTLQGYYFYGIAFAPLPIVAFVILLLLCLSSATRVAQRDSEYAISVVVLFLASTLVSVFDWGTTISIRNISGNVLGPIFALAFVSYFRARTGALVCYLALTLTIHVTAIAAQYYCLYVLGFYLDLLVAVTGEEQRYLNRLTRPTGLFPEPADYAMYVIALAFMLTRFRSPLTLLSFAALLTILFNFSLMGIILTTTFMLCYCVARRKEAIKVVIGAAVLVLVTLQLPVGDVFTLNLFTRVVGIQNDNSFDDRYVSGLNYFAALPTISQLFGIGLGNFGEFVSYGSTYSYYLVHLGIVPTCVLFALGIRYLRCVCSVSITALSFLGIFFFGAMIPAHIMFWMIIAAVSVLEKATVPGGITTQMPLGSWRSTRPTRQKFLQPNALDA